MTNETIEKKSAKYFQDLAASVHEWDKLVPGDSAIAKNLYARSTMRRVRLCFLVLHDYLALTAGKSEEMNQKPLEELADFFVEKKVLQSDEKESFVLLGSLYSVIRWPAPGMLLDEEKCMAQIPNIHQFLQAFIARHKSQLSVVSETVASSIL